jgi:cysteine synthase A
MQGTLHAIGNTPLVKLAHIPDKGGAAVYVKLEYFNPTASYKDRMALSVIEEGERRGVLRPGMTVVENTAGSTGTSLALVCRAKGYPFLAVSSNAFSKEKLRAIQLFGGKLELLDNEGRGITPDLVPRMMNRARELSREEGYYWTRQFENEDVLKGYGKMAAELLAQLPQPPALFCAGVGTAGMFVGVMNELRRAHPTLKGIVLEPLSAPLLSRGQKGTHAVEGIAPGFMPPFLDGFPYDGVEAIDEEEARGMARRLAAEEGIFAGLSSGLNVAAAVRLASRMQPHEDVVTVACDSGLKYLSTGLFA